MACYVTFCVKRIQYLLSMRQQLKFDSKPEHKKCIYIFCDWIRMKWEHTRFVNAIEVASNAIKCSHFFELHSTRWNFCTFCIWNVFCRRKEYAFAESMSQRMTIDADKYVNSRKKQDVFCELFSSQKWVSIVQERTIFFTKLQIHISMK